MRRDVLSQRVRLRSCFRSAVASLHGTGARRASRMPKANGVIEMQKKEMIWVLTTVDDRQVLGEKAVVSIHRSLSAALRELLVDLKEVMSHRNLNDSDVERDMGSLFLQTRDRMNCWFIECKEV